MTGQVAFLPAVLRDRLKTTGSHIETFCQQWNIQELALFGSVVRDDFNSNSDIDVLIELEPTANIGLFDIVRMKAELSALFNRPVDLTQKRLIKNPFSRPEILKTYRVIYPAETANFTGLITANTLMTENVRDNASLFDMVKAMQAIGRFVPGRTFEDYLTDEMFQGAIERKLEILGEAANRISSSFQSKHPEIDWGEIVGLRNVIIHQYDELDYERVWNIATRDVPVLLKKVQPLVPELPANNELTDG
ncbi:MAG: HepT-like ribonuclease domain-containing protein [Phormidesmis sp.]